MMIVNDHNLQVNPDAETAALAKLAALLRGFTADRRRAEHERVLFAATAVLLERAARLRDADDDVDLPAQVEDALETAMRVAKALRSET